MANPIDIKGFYRRTPHFGFQWFIVAMCFLVVVADGMDAAIIACHPSHSPGMEYLSPGVSGSSSAQQDSG